MREALLLVRATVMSLAFAFSPTGSIGASRNRSSPASFIPPPFWSLSRRGAGQRTWASRGALAGDCYVRKKPSRAKSVDNLNYISHHNPREPVKPTPAFCPGAPRVGSSEWAPAMPRRGDSAALSLLVLRPSRVYPPSHPFILLFFILYFPFAPGIIRADHVDD